MAVEKKCCFETSKRRIENQQVLQHCRHFYVYTVSIGETRSLLHL